MAKFVVDILKTELDKRLPYWLSAAGKNYHRLAEIREKKRAEHNSKERARRASEQTAAMGRS